MGSVNANGMRRAQVAGLLHCVLLRPHLGFLSQSRLQQGHPGHLSIRLVGLHHSFHTAYGSFIEMVFT